MHKDDFIRLRHMLDAAKELEDFTHSKTRQDLDDDRLLALGVIKAIEIVGEAASKVSTDVKSQFSDIPWEDITGMRNRLIHVYFRVDLNRVWDTVKEDIPKLKSILERIITDNWME